MGTWLDLLLIKPYLFQLKMVPRIRVQGSGQFEPTLESSWRFPSQISLQISVTYKGLDSTLYQVIMSNYIFCKSVC